MTRLLILRLSLVTGAILGSWGNAFAQQTAVDMSYRGQTVPGELVVGQPSTGDIAASTVFAIKPGCQPTQMIEVARADEFWLVSARDSHLCPCDLSRVTVEKLVGGQWQTESIESLVDHHANDISKTTMVYVHGNRTDREFAIARGLQFYQNAFQLRACPRRAVRFVMFAWRAEAELKRIYPDFEIKCERSCIVGKTFGAFLNAFSDRNLLLCGFSLGSQVVLTGVSCDADRCPQGQLKSGQYRVAVIAPAFDPSFIASQLLAYADNPVVAETDVFKNLEDRAMKAATLIARKRSEAQVTTLAQLSRMGNGSNRIQIFNVTAEISRKHAIEKYSLSPTLQAKLVAMLDDVWVARMAAHNATAPSLVNPASGGPITVAPLQLP